MRIGLGRFAPLVAAGVLVAGFGAAAIAAQLAADHRVASVHQADRTGEQLVLAGLTQQYLEFTELQTANATAGSWRLSPGNAADRARLAAIVAGSPLTNLGAALVSLNGTPLTVYPNASVAPSPTDPGLLPLESGLLHGQPGLSSVMLVHGRAVVAFAVPIGSAGSYRALLVTFADARTWPLEGYTQRLTLGATASPLIIDSSGTVAAALDPSLVGHPAPASPGVRAALAGHSGFATFKRGSTDYIVSYAPAGFGGWAVLTEQRVGAFSGALTADLTRTVFALLAFLVVAVAGLFLLNFKRQEALSKLADEALYDPLTGLAQRRLFTIRYEDALARHRRTHTSLALLYCDLDSFKQVNDRFGHNRGDELLTTIAKRLSETVRDTDLVARLGGDEFAILCEAGTDPQTVLTLARRLRSTISAPVQLGPSSYTPSISVGVGILGADASPDSDLIQTADFAMYEAKGGDSGIAVTVIGGSPAPQAVTVPSQDERATTS
ncbi:MAG TPA: sensor domain-containing diguanylate cyclase [Mycobacteriales bacterium]|nr:sensor domain-containing diguanylate cyclase [Mycobacteriales bacterium]